MGDSYLRHPYNSSVLSVWTAMFQMCYQDVAIVQIQISSWDWFFCFTSSFVAARTNCLHYITNLCLYHSLDDAIRWNTAAYLSAFFNYFLLFLPMFTIDRIVPDFSLTSTTCQKWYNGCTASFAFSTAKTFWIFSHLMGVKQSYLWILYKESCLSETG